MAGDNVQTNISITEEDARKLDQMMVEDAYDNRSAWIRRLIRMEWIKRYGRTETAASVPAEVK